MSLYDEIVSLINDAYERAQHDTDVGTSTDLSYLYYRAYIVSGAGAEFCPHMDEGYVPESIEAKVNLSLTLKN